MIEAFWLLISSFFGFFNREPITVNSERLLEKLPKHTVKEESNSSPQRVQRRMIFPLPLRGRQRKTTRQFRCNKGPRSLWTAYVASAFIARRAGPFLLSVLSAESKIEFLLCVLCGSAVKMEARRPCGTHSINEG